jgi:hypothetical protein
VYAPLTSAQVVKKLLARLKALVDMSGGASSPALHDTTACFVRLQLKWAPASASRHRDRIGGRLKL